MSVTKEIETENDPAIALNVALDSGSLFQVKQMMKTLSTAGIAHLLESSPPKTRSVLWELIDKDAEGEVLQYLNEDIQNEFLKELNAKQVAEITEGLATDDLVDILQQLPQKITSQVLSAMDEHDRSRVETVLSYNEDTAGGLMNTDTITVRPAHTLELILRYLRRHNALPEMTDNLYVVNREDEFMGAIPLRTLLVSDPSTLASEVMLDGVKGVHVDMDAEQVAQLFERYDWVSAPVISADNKLLGRITIDDIVDVIRDSTEHSFMSMAGLDEEDDTFAPVIKTARRRAPWLGVNLTTAVFASAVIYLFQDTLDSAVALAVLMPIVANMGGVAGSQTLTLMIRSLALGHITLLNRRWLLIRELGAASINGSVWATVIGGITYFWYRDAGLSLIIACALAVNIISAALAGAYLPLVLDKLKIDPALAGSVALTTVTDSVGFFAFLGLANLFYL